MDEEERYMLGRQVVLDVWGEQHGAEILDRLNSLAPDLENQIVSHLYGNLWARPSPPAPDRKTRSLITIAALTALHCPNQLRVHIVGALNNGATEEEIVETILQVGLLAGFPTSWDGLIMCRQVFQEYGDGRFHGGEVGAAIAPSFGG